MLAQKLTRITFKKADLEEYHELKRKRKEQEARTTEQQKPSAGQEKKMAPRKVLSFGTGVGRSPTRSSTPDQ